MRSSSHHKGLCRRRIYTAIVDDFGRTVEEKGELFVVIHQGRPDDGALFELLSSKGLNP